MAEATYPSGEAAEPSSQTINKRLEEFRKFASVSFTRARQYTTEKLGKADSVTELDSEFESLSHQLDQIKTATVKILSHVESLVHPHPGLQSLVYYSRLDRPRPQRSTIHEALGVELDKAGNTYGTESQYGAYLLSCSQVEMKLGESQRRFQEKAQAEFITPLHAFLEIDVKQVMKEKRNLNVKRLDLDACRTKAKKAQPGEKQQAAESELRTAQAEYDMQLDKVRSSLKKIVHTHVNHMGHLRALMSAQRAFFAECLAHLGDIEGDAPRGPPVSVLSGGGGGGGGEGVPREEGKGGKLVVDGLELDREEERKARVLYDYDAENERELSFLADQIIKVIPIPDEEDYMMAEHDGQHGRIPSTYVELL